MERRSMDRKERVVRLITNPRMYACIAVVWALHGYHGWRREQDRAQYNSHLTRQQDTIAQLSSQCDAQYQYNKQVAAYIAYINSAINAEAQEQGVVNRLRLNIDDTIGGPEPDFCLEVGEGLGRQRAYFRIDEKPIEHYFPEKR